MALDFKTMSTEKKVVLCGSVLAAVFALVAFIVCFTVPGSQKGIIKAMVGLKEDGYSNPVGGYAWIAGFTFLAGLCLAAIFGVKEHTLKLLPSLNLKMVAPLVIILTGFFASMYISHCAFYQGGETFLGVLVLVFLILYTAIFALLALDNLSDIMAALPYILLAVGGLFLVIATIKCLAYPGIEKASEEAMKAALAAVVGNGGGELSVGTPFGLLKTALIINSVAAVGAGVLTVLPFVKEK